MPPQWRAAISAARNTILACALAFVFGVLSVRPPDPEPAPVVTITDRTVRQLARALERARTDPTTPRALVDQAEDVLDQIDQGAVTVTPTPTTPTSRAPEPWHTPNPTTTTTPPTTAPPATTIPPPPDDTFRWPTTTEVTP